jgi:hypothetical protein
LGNWLNRGICTNSVAFVSTSRSPLNRFIRCAGPRLHEQSLTSEFLTRPLSCFGYDNHADRRSRAHPRP